MFTTAGCKVAIRSAARGPSWPASAGSGMNGRTAEMATIANHAADFCNKHVTTEVLAVGRPCLDGGTCRRLIRVIRHAPFGRPSVAEFGHFARFSQDCGQLKADLIH